MTKTIKGFITNLGKYNEGYLIGEWIEFPINEDDLQNVLDRIGINEEYEEFFFTDWEYEFNLNFGEYENINHINEIAERLEGVDGEKLQAYMEAFNSKLNIALEELDDCTFYPDMTLEDVAYELVKDCYFTNETPEIFKRYFDYKGFARDLEFDGYIETSNGVIERC